MTTKVQITNIVEEGNAHSNGDLVVEGLGEKRVLFPGDTMEAWMVAGAVTLSEQWPSQKPKEGV